MTGRGSIDHHKLLASFFDNAGKCLEYSNLFCAGKTQIFPIKNHGLIIIAPKKDWTLYDYMENIIHEMSHIELYIKQLVDPLIIKGNYLKSPFRKQPRPASGVYHAAFVLARIIRYMAPFCTNSQHAAHLKDRIDACRILLDETLSQFHDKKSLTPAGEHLLHEMCILAKTSKPFHHDVTIGNEKR